jgi:hypothetical protein
MTNSLTFPAILLATEYHQRWEIESTIDELKTHLLGRKILVRWLNPRVIKKTRSKFPAKKPFHRGTGTQRQSLNFSIANTA